MVKPTTATGAELEAMRKVAEKIREHLIEQFHLKLKSMQFEIAIASNDVFMRQIDGIINALVHFTAHSVSHVHQAILRATVDGIHDQSIDAIFIDNFIEHLRETFFKDMQIYRDRERH